MRAGIRNVSPQCFPILHKNEGILIYVSSNPSRTFSVVGTSVPRVDGVAKVTGKAKYVADLVVPGMVEGKFLRSPYAHARVVSIDSSEAESMAGVFAIITRD